MKLLKLFTAVFNPAPEAPEPKTLQQLPLDDLEFKFNHARLAQAAHARRIAAFGRDYPELWQQYFTRAGESQRKRASNEAA